MGENSGRVVLCGANAYEQKYYFNEKFSRIPESIKEELHIICVLFTEEVGGVFTVVSAAGCWSGRSGCSGRSCWSRLACTTGCLYFASLSIHSLEKNSRCRNLND